ncbi:MAG: hypothetical protein RMI56_00705 [Sulfolobales archaeon]|nr:hypothetical protein [Sulfolobales archaeon]MDW8082300.1 hypothetical protein [Sulfolobales archaeon]
MGDLHGRAAKTYFSVLITLLIALSISTAVLYFQYRDASALLRECRNTLSTSKNEVESLRQYGYRLYMNYTELYRFTESLVANYTELRGRYIALIERYELTLSMLEATQKLYEELYSSHAELKAMYKNVIEHLKVLDEVLELVKKLRLYYLLSQAESFEYINGSLIKILSNYSSSAKLIRAWTRTIFTNTTLNIPTPELGFLVVNYNNTYRDCLNITAVNAYIVPGRYSARTIYYTARTCLTEGVLLIPVLPHQTTLELNIVRVTIGTTTRYTPQVTLKFHYLLIN